MEDSESHQVWIGECGFCAKKQNFSTERKESLKNIDRFPSRVFGSSAVIIATLSQASK